MGSLVPRRDRVAVPTSVGYGAAFGGLAALLGMLNSCSPNVCVVNIDNGFGAAHAVARLIGPPVSAEPEPPAARPLSAETEDHRAARVR